MRQGKINRFAKVEKGDIPYLRYISFGLAVVPECTVRRYFFMISVSNASPLSERTEEIVITDVSPSRSTVR